MKIGIVCPYDYFRHGGVQEHIRAVATELKKRDYDVKVITINAPDGENKDPENVITLGVSTRINGASSFELSASASPSEIDEMLEREQFDVLHFHEPMLPLMSGQLLSRSNAVNIATFHAHKTEDIVTKSLDFIYLPYHRNRSKYVNAITAVSDAAAVFVSKATDEDIEIIPNGIVLDTFQPENTEPYADFDDDVKTVLYIGRLEKRKGVEYLLRAYEVLRERHEKVRLVVCGDGPKMRTLTNYVDQYDVPDVHFLGFVSEEDKLKLLKTCDLYVSPALYGESFGIVLLEAMAMGAPLLGGDNDGYITVLKEKGLLSLIDPKHLDDFVRRMELILFDDDIAEMMRSWGLEYVKQFDYSIVTDKYLKLYEKTLREHS